MAFLDTHPEGFTIADGGLDDLIAASTAFLFEATGTTSHETFSQKLIADRSAGGTLAAGTQDRFTGSALFAELVAGEALRRFAARLVECPPERVLLAFPHLRIDLPSEFQADEKRLNLPWHQEADYYLPKGDCSTKSLVISTPLFDCARHDGALVAGAFSHAQGQETHAMVFMDPQNNRHKRVICTPPESETVLETVRGQSQVISFLTKHKSGVNTGSFVRCTFLVRVSDRLDVAEATGLAASA
ncbi:hypothetical protein [Stappia sp. ES.058]|uniref:hypothetical protein n=1 Tax=Stappia sp. ES.058 TaxID=1881061 RepID=UPI00087B6DEC|nr:hypothetical protein [Stappia sp. ES.058]SDU24890.1 hypothetical protein SAMN05428979_2529 [Stappia sp. ES.058]